MNETYTQAEFEDSIIESLNNIYRITEIEEEKRAEHHLVAVSFSRRHKHLIEIIGTLRDIIIRLLEDNRYLKRQIKCFAYDARNMYSMADESYRSRIDSELPNSRINFYKSKCDIDNICNPDKSANYQYDVKRIIDGLKLIEDYYKDV